MQKLAGEVPVFFPSKVVLDRHQSSDFFSFDFFIEFFELSYSACLEPHVSAIPSEVGSLVRQLSICWLSDKAAYPEELRVGVST